MEGLMMKAGYYKGKKIKGIWLRKTTILLRGIKYLNIFANGNENFKSTKQVNMIKEKLWNEEITFNKKLKSINISKLIEQTKQSNKGKRRKHETETKFQWK